MPSRLWLLLLPLSACSDIFVDSSHGSDASVDPHNADTPLSSLSAAAAFGISKNLTALRVLVVGAYGASLRDCTRPILFLSNDVHISFNGSLHAPPCALRVAANNSLRISHLSTSTPPLAISLTAPNLTLLSANITDAANLTLTASSLVLSNVAAAPAGQILIAATSLSAHAAVFAAGGLSSNVSVDLSVDAATFDSCAFASGSASAWGLFVRTGKTLFVNSTFSTPLGVEVEGLLTFASSALVQFLNCTVRDAAITRSAISGTGGLVLSGSIFRNVSSRRESAVSVTRGTLAVKDCEFVNLRSALAAVAIAVSDGSFF
jgi:hypothetical protein